MSVRLLSKYRKSLEDFSNLSPGARFVLHLYCDWADNFVLTAFPGTPTLMHATGYSERQVQRYVQECRDRGFLSIVKNRGGRRQFAVYRVNLGVPVIDPDKIPPDVREKLVRMGVMSGDGAGGVQDADAGEAEVEDELAIGSE